MLGLGQSPYDLQALAALGRQEHVSFLLGTGYSYPLPFAVVAMPLSALPFEVAAWVFTAVSAIAFGAAVAAWLVAVPAPWPGRTPRRWLAVATGLYPPVWQSLFYGQVNLLVLALLAFGLLPVARAAAAYREDASGRDPLRAGSGGRGIVSGLLLGLAGVVKLVPLALVVPLALARRGWEAASIAIAAGAAVALATIAFPFAGSSSAGPFSQLLGSDTFWTNQSVNGFVSRLFVPSARTVPLASGVDVAAAVALVTGALALLVLFVLWRGRVALPWPVPLALACALTIVAAVAGAPKDSFWNHVPALVAVGLLLAALSARPAVRGGGATIPRADRVLLAIWYGAAFVQVLIDQSEGGATLALGPIGSVVSSTALFGLFALFGLLVRRFVAATARAGDTTRAEAGEATLAAADRT